MLTLPEIAEPSATPMNMPSLFSSSVPVQRSSLPARPVFPSRREGGELRVLVVDSDPASRASLCDYLPQFGLRPIAIADCAALRHAASFTSFDAIVLDLALADGDGLRLLQSLQLPKRVPVLVLSARAETLDRIIGLEMGADDYIAKPCEPRELVARLSAVLRRFDPALDARRSDAGNGDTEFQFAGWSMVPARWELWSPEGEQVVLSSAEYRTLHALVKRPGRVLTRGQLMEASGSHSDQGLARSTDIMVSRLRRKLRDDARKPKLIRTVKFEGYALAVEVMAQVV